MFDRLSVRINRLEHVNCKILPIVDITHTNSNFLSVITKVTNNLIPYILIVNSNYSGKVAPQQKKLNQELIQSLENISNNKIIIGIYIDYINIESTKILLQKYSNKKIVLFHDNINGFNINLFSKIFKYSNVLYHVFKNHALKQDYQKYFYELNNKVIIEDPFIKRIPNSQYNTVNASDEKYYDLHIRYKKDGYIGFGDFLTIGGEPQEGHARAPKTIVIHYSYPEDISKNMIWIKRFFGIVKQEYATQSFARLEAMEKLTDFITSHSALICNICPSCNDLMKNVGSRTSYSLGKLKQFSMLHHCYMIIKICNF